MNSKGAQNIFRIIIIINRSFILIGGLVSSLTMTGDYQSVHINRNFILYVFILTRVLAAGKRS